MYTSRLTGEQIDNALILARSIGQGTGVPLGRGNGSIQTMKLDTILSQAANGIPTSAAVYAALSDRLSAYLIFRGTVSTAASLPDDPEVGDAYHVSASGQNLAWDGTQWADVGQIGVFEITPEDIGAASQEELSALSESMVKMVNGKEPDTTGNVQLLASDIPVESGGSKIDQVLTTLMQQVTALMQLVDAMEYRVATKDESGVSVPANDRISNHYLPVAESGWEAIGIVGVRLGSTGSSTCVCYSYGIGVNPTDATESVVLNIRNYGSSAASLALHIDVLYRKVV